MRLALFFASLLAALPFVACDSFGTASDAPAGSDSGTTSSGSDAAADASVDATGDGDCVTVPAFEQPFTGGLFPGWTTEAGDNKTAAASFTPAASGGEASDGALRFSFVTTAMAKRYVVKRALPRDAQCFDFRVDFKVSGISGAQILFSEVKFDNGYFLILTVDGNNKHLLVSQQHYPEEGVVRLGASAPITENEWHHARLGLDRRHGGASLTAAIDDSPIDCTENPLFDFGHTDTVEVGVSYVAASGAGDVTIDRVGFR